MIEKSEIKDKFLNLINMSTVFGDDLVKLCDDSAFPDNVFAVFAENRDQIIKADSNDVAGEAVKFLLFLGEYYKEKEEISNSLCAALEFVNLQGVMEISSDFTCSVLPGMSGSENRSVFIVNGSRYVEYDGESMVEIEE